MATSAIMGIKTALDKKMQRSITNINPNAADSDIVDFIEGLNGLSTNTLTEVRRVDTTELLNDTRADRNLRLIRADTSAELTTIAFTDLPSTIDTGINPLTIQCDGEYSLTDLALTKNIEGTAFIFCDWYGADDTKYFEIIKNISDQADTASGTITLSLPGTTNYKPAAVTITIT